MDPWTSGPLDQCESLGGWFTGTSFQPAQSIPDKATETDLVKGSTLVEEQQTIGRRKTSSTSRAHTSRKRDRAVSMLQSQEPTAPAQRVFTYKGHRKEEEEGRKSTTGKLQVANLAILKPLHVSFF